MELNIIVAIAEDGVIGFHNKLLWHLPADLKRFKQTTMGCSVVMGRKTYESIGRPLPGRVNIIVSRNPDYKVDGCLVFSSVNEALNAAQQYEKVFIIGGGEIYKQTIDFAQHIYLSKVHATFEGDTYFPKIDPRTWLLTSCEKHPADEKNQFDFDFMVYSRVNIGLN